MPFYGQPETSKGDVDMLIRIMCKITGQSPISGNVIMASAENGKFYLTMADVQKQMKNFIRDSSLKIYS